MPRRLHALKPAVITALAALSISPAGAQESVQQGAALYRSRCGLCHEPGGTGTFMLSRRLGRERGLLAGRTDLTDGYVMQVVRHGLMSMPRFTRVELTDAELASIAAYLAAGKQR
jgi:mono/diheme cytochrome c family protein